MEPRFDESSVKRTTFFVPIVIKYIKNNIDITKPSYSEHSLLIPWPFVIWRLHCNKLLYRVLVFNSQSHPLHRFCSATNPLLIVTIFYDPINTN